MSTRPSWSGRQDENLNVVLGELPAPINGRKVRRRQDRRRGAIRHDAGARRQAQLAVEDDADRRGTFHEPGRKPRIVGRHGARADEDRRMRRAQRVRHRQGLLPADPLRIAGPRGETPVDRLGVMDGDRWPGGLAGQNVSEADGFRLEIRLVYGLGSAGSGTCS